MAEADTTAALRYEVMELQQQVDALRRDPLVARLTRLRASSPSRALRRNTLAQRIYDTVRR